VETFALRRYIASRRLIETTDRLQAILATYGAAGDAGATLAEAVTASGIPRPIVARATLWLLKYHFLEEAA